MTTDLQVRLQKDGKLMVIRNNGACIFDFNQNYEGYYPSCRWTAAGRGEILYLAGTDDNEVPHLFSSAGGETWTEQNIRTRIGLPDPMEYGDIIQILWEGKNRQLFLVTKNGYLVTLPDCSKCVRARHVSDRRLIDAKIEGEVIFLIGEGGEQIRIPVGSASQYRCSWSFAMPFLKEGGLLFDLRDAVERQLLPVPVAIRMEIGDLEGLLGGMTKGRPLFFFCGHGYLADQAVRDARQAGFVHAYSLGGIYGILEDQAGA